MVWTYINGELLSITTADNALFGGQTTNPYDLRILFGGSTKGDKFMVDDYSITQTALPPMPYDAPSITANSSAELNGNKIETTSSSVKASNLACTDGASVRAYVDSTLKTQNISTLNTGDIIVVEGVNGIITFYDVVVNPYYGIGFSCNATKKYEIDENNTSILSLTQEAGKTVIYPEFYNNIPYDSKYIVMDFDIKFENIANDATMALATAYSTRLTDEIPVSDFTDDYKHVKLIIDNSKQDKTTAVLDKDGNVLYNALSVTHNLYIDNAFVVTKDTYLTSLYYYASESDAVHYNKIPLRILLTNNGTVATMYLKNVKITTSNENLSAPAIALSGDTYTVTADVAESNAAIFVAQFDDDGVFQGIAKGKVGEDTVSVSSTYPKLEAYVMNLTSFSPKYTTKTFGSDN